MTLDPFRPADNWTPCPSCLAWHAWNNDEGPIEAYACMHCAHEFTADDHEFTVSQVPEDYARTPMPDDGSPYRHHLLNLLARIHSDGGHYVVRHGLEKAVEDADLKVATLLVANNEIARLKAVVADYQKLVSMYKQLVDKIR